MAHGVVLPVLDSTVAPDPEFRLCYQSAVGALMYAMLTTRPDLAFAVSVVSRFSSNPVPAHWSAVKGILRYLQGTLDQQLTFRGDLTPLTGYTDADYAGDVATRRSTSGYVFNLGSGAISWQSKRQNTVAMSTCEAEYIGQSNATLEAIWLRQLLSEMLPESIPAPVGLRLLADNQSAIALASNPSVHARSKHIDVRHHHQRECIASGFIKIEYVPTGDQVADIMTKPLSKVPFIKFRDLLGLERHDLDH